MRSKVFCDRTSVGLRNGLCRTHLFVFGQSFGIIDLYEHRSRRNVLAAFGRDFLDPSVDTRGYIEACCIDLTLYEKRFRSQEIEDRQRDDDSCNDTNDNGRSAGHDARIPLSRIWRLGHTLSFFTWSHVHARLRSSHDWYR